MSSSKGFDNISEAYDTETIPTAVPLYSSIIQGFLKMPLSEVRISQGESVPAFGKMLLPDYKCNDVEVCSSLICPIRFSNVTGSLIRHSFPLKWEIFCQNPLSKTCKIK